MCLDQTSNVYFASMTTFVGQLLFTTFLGNKYFVYINYAKLKWYTGQSWG